MTETKRTTRVDPPLVSLFVAERYADRRDVSAVIAPPYDVIGPAEWKALAARDPHNIVRLILPEDGEDRYRHAADTLAAWRAEGVVVTEDRPAVWVLRQAFVTADGVRRERTGVIGAISVEPFSEGRIKPHERTHAGPKEDRMALLQATETMFEALLMLSRDEDGTLQLRLAEATDKRPCAIGTLEGVELTLWRVSGRRGEAIARAAGRGPVYLADGHHRYETAVAYRDVHPSADRTLGLIVPLNDPGLVVLPTHRVLRGEAFDAEPLVKALHDRFQIRELEAETNYMAELGALRDRGTACVVVLPGEKALALLLKGGASLGELPFANEPSVASLDVARIDEIVVRRLRAAAGRESDVGYDSDPDSVIRAVRQGQAAAGILLNPASVEQVLAVADAGAAMPQKSTYFTPKVPSGLSFLRYGESP
jgi:uncharacterized protein (DUF1015 family)